MPRWPGMRIRKALCGHEAGNGGYRQGEEPTCAYDNPGGQGVHREVESGGHEENCRAVVEETNRSAKGGTRSSLHYGGEGATHPPTAPRCVRTARQGRSVGNPRRTHVVPGGSGISDPISLQSEGGSDAA